MTDIEMINDAFWLKFAKDQVTRSITARDEAAAKLDTFITYVWGIYTAVFTTALAFDKIPDSTWTCVIMILPVIFFPACKFLCMNVQLPVPVNFYPNIPESIEYDAYAAILRAKNRKLNVAKTGSIIAALSIALAIFVFKFNSFASAESWLRDSYVKTTYSRDCRLLKIAGVAEPDRSLTLYVTGLDSLKDQHSIEISKLKSDSQGRFDTMLSSNGIENKIRAYVSWADKKNIMRTIKN